MKDPRDPSVSAQAATDAKTHPNLAQLSAKLQESIPATLDELQADQIPWNNPHWHPAHGGIYRNVRLIVTNSLHFSLPLYSFLQTEGPYAYATDITEKSAQIGLEIPLRNDGPTTADGEIHADILDADGRSVFSNSVRVVVPAGGSTKLKLGGTVAQPRLWEPAYPHLYRVVLKLTRRDNVLDSTEIPLGIRAIRWDAGAGLFVNGAHLKLHGWGQKSTNEWPGLGAALPDWMQFLTLQMMRDAGGNFLRWGHVPGGPAQIASADRLGIITLQPGGDGEHDTVGGAWALRVANFRDVLIYYRNNPSIFIWEGGNQKVSRAHAAELIRTAAGPMPTAAPMPSRPSSWTSASAPRAAARSPACPSSRVNTTARNPPGASGTTPRPPTSATPRRRGRPTSSPPSNSPPTRSATT
jgi:beta-galactosidase